MKENTRKSVLWWSGVAALGYTATVMGFIVTEPNTVVILLLILSVMADLKATILGKE